MKKLMFAVAMAAAMTASADWSWGINFSKGTATGTAYLFYTAENLTETDAGLKNFYEGFEDGGNFGAYVTSKGGTFINDGVAFENGKGDVKFKVTGDVPTGYFYACYVDANNNLILSQGVRSEFPATVNTYGMDGEYINSGKTVSAIPEPTSALLMLLGMAGLALRRKQA